MECIECGKPARIGRYCSKKCMKIVFKRRLDAIDNPPPVDPKWLRRASFEIRRKIKK